MNAFEDAIERGEIDLGEYEESFPGLIDVVDFAAAPDNDCERWRELVAVVGQECMASDWRRRFSASGDTIHQYVFRVPTIAPFIHQVTRDINDPYESFSVSVEMATVVLSLVRSRLLGQGGAA